MRHDLTAEELRALLDYDPVAGVFIWKTRTEMTREDKIFNTKCAGRLAGTHDDNGYNQIRIHGYTYRAHRLVWLHVYGRWPLHVIDHENGVTGDNRLSELREATRAENQQNQKLNSRNKSGVDGVSWDKKREKWRVCIGVDGKHNHIGRFSDFDEACAAHVKAKANFHKFNPAHRNHSITVREVA
jgi:hypothetical protein